MVYHKIVELMKRRIDELTDDEFAIVKDYCEQETTRRAGAQQAHNIAAEIVRQTIQKIEGDRNA